MLQRGCLCLKQDIQVGSDLASVVKRAEIMFVLEHHGVRSEGWRSDCYKMYFSSRRRLHVLKACKMVAFPDNSGFRYLIFKG